MRKEREKKFREIKLEKKPQRATGIDGHLPPDHMGGGACNGVSQPGVRTKTLPQLQQQQMSSSYSDITLSRASEPVKWPSVEIPNLTVTYIEYTPRANAALAY